MIDELPKVSVLYLCDVSVTLDDVGLQLAMMGDDAPAGSVCAENGNLLGMFAPPCHPSFATMDATTFSAVAAIPRTPTHLLDEEW